MTQCGWADGPLDFEEPHGCSTETDVFYMMLAEYHGYSVWVWVPLCDKHAPPDKKVTT